MQYALTIFVTFAALCALSSPARQGIAIAIAVDHGRKAVSRGTIASPYHSDSERGGRKPEAERNAQESS